MTFDNMLRYCAALEKNNNRPWFHENHGQYETAMSDFTELVNRLKFRVAEFADEETASRIVFTPPKSMLYRIPRDARVYKDKPPYNPSFRARIAVDKKVLLPLGYFIMIAPGGRSHFGTGAWCPDGTMVHRVRQYISAHWEEFMEIVLENGIEVTGEKLKRVPPDFEADHPAGEYLKHKNWFTLRNFADSELGDFDSFESLICGELRRLEPFRRFMNEALRERRESAWPDFGF